MQKQKNRRAATILIMILASLFWGLSFTATDLVMERLEPVQIITLRWTIAAILFGGMVLFGKIRLDLRKKQFIWLLLCGITEPGLYSLFETYGLRMTSPSISSIFISTIPCMVIILGVLFFHLKIDRISVLSIIIAFTGVTICTVFSPSFQASGSMLGCLLMMGAVILGALYAFFSASASRGYNSVEITAMMAFVGVIMFTPMNFALGYGLETYKVFFTEGKVTVGILFLGIFCSCLCYIALNYVLSYLNPAIVNNITSALVTLIGVTAGILIVGDPWGPYTIAGLIITLFGVLLSSKKIE